MKDKIKVDELKVNDIIQHRNSTGLFDRKILYIGEQEIFFVNEDDELKREGSMGWSELKHWVLYKEKPPLLNYFDNLNPSEEFDKSKLNPRDFSLFQLGHSHCKERVRKVFKEWVEQNFYTGMGK